MSTTLRTHIQERQVHGYSPHGTPALHPPWCYKSEKAKGCVRVCVCVCVCTKKETGSLSTFPIVRERKPDCPTNSTSCPSSASTPASSLNSYVPSHELLGQHHKTKTQCSFLTQAGGE